MLAVPDTKCGWPLLAGVLPVNQAA